MRAAEEVALLSQYASALGRTMVKEPNYVNVPLAHGIYCDSCGWHHDLCVCDAPAEERDRGRKQAALMKHMTRTKSDG